MWIHHVTKIENLEKILKEGLLSRNELLKNKIKFEDIANKNIIQERNGLNNYIPFHINILQTKWGIPYNYRILKTYGAENIIFLTCNIDELTDYNVECFLYHPISNYKRKFLVKDFKKMLEIEENKLISNGYLDYNDNKIQQFLMSEILIESKVVLNEKWRIYVYSDIQRKWVLKILQRYNLDIVVRVDEERYVYRGF